MLVTDQALLSDYIFVLFRAAGVFAIRKVFVQIVVSEEINLIHALSPSSLTTIVNL